MFGNLGGLDVTYAPSASAWFVAGVGANIIIMSSDGIFWTFVDASTLSGDGNAIASSVALPM
jgi:hypothetical protein